MSWCIVIAVLLCAPCSVRAIDWTAGATGFVENQAGLRLPFRFYSPPTELIPDRGLPLVVQLHGSSSRGRDNIQQVNREYFQDLLDATQTEPFAAFLVAPQLPPNGGGWNRSVKKLVLEMVESVVDRYPVDPARIFVMGYSAGGFGTTEMVNESPHLFAAGAPIAGVNPRLDVTPFQHVPLAFFHGAKDRIVRDVVSDMLVDRLRGVGAAPVYVKTDDNHSTISRVYKSDELGMYEWMFQQENPQVMVKDTLHVGGWKSIGIHSASEPRGLQLESHQRLHIELDGSTGHDLVVAGSLTVEDAELKVVRLAGEPKLNDEFPIFDVGTFNGEFGRFILPALPAQWAWDTEQLAPQGILRVISQTEAIQCDLSSDDRCTVADVDRLVSVADLTAGVEVHRDNRAWDINHDGRIDQGDLRRWLSVAADLNGLASPYAPGDTDLNGRVELSDFRQLERHFSQSQDIGWSHGDSDGNGVVEFSDFLRLSIHFTDSSRAAVPEPESAGTLIVAVLVMLKYRIRREQRGHDAVAD